MHVDWLLVVGGLILIGVSVLGVYQPDLVWGRPRRAPQSEADGARLRRRRMIGTLVYFAAGALLLVLSIR